MQRITKLVALILLTQSVPLFAHFNGTWTGTPTLFTQTEKIQCLPLSISFRHDHPWSLTIGDKFISCSQPGSIAYYYPTSKTRYAIYGEDLVFGGKRVGTITADKVTLHLSSMEIEFSLQGTSTLQFRLREKELDWEVRGTLKR